ncbi:MAG: DEAD/DEAH box helicase [Chlamydiia bacterium]
MEFSDLGLDPIILEALKRLQHAVPTPVQQRVIPLALEGKDLLVSSHTGSGKTGAFVLPALQRLIENRAKGLDSSGAQVLIVTPTRELALQVEKAIHGYAAGQRGVRTACLIGGAPFGLQQRALRRGTEIIIATPGRLLDHLSRGPLLDDVSILVLDEADRMLDMGFSDDIEAIVEALPEHQTLLFSATLDGKVAHLAKRYTRDPLRIEIEQEIDSLVLTQLVHMADDLRHKFRLLEAVLNGEGVHQTIVFTATKSAAEEIAEQLCDQGYAAAALHGDMSQRARCRVIRHVHEGKVTTLVATDVAARGIDVATISHVVNFDLPMDTENYVHRIGRTARAGRSGTSITFVSNADRRKLVDIERMLGTQIEVKEIPGLEPRVRQRALPPERQGHPREPRGSFQGRRGPSTFRDSHRPMRKGHAAR